MLCVFHLQVGEVWSEVCAELREEFRPIGSDEEILKVISEVSENIGKMVTAYQTEVLENRHQQDIQEEEKTYTQVSQGVFIQVKSMEFFCQLV